MSKGGKGSKRSSHHGLARDLEAVYLNTASTLWQRGKVSKWRKVSKESKVGVEAGRCAMA